MGECNMEEQIYSYMEWNIRGAGGSQYTTPHFVPEYVYKKQADIVVLTEFVISPTFDYLVSLLRKKYFVFISPYVVGYNQVLIGLDMHKFPKSSITDIQSYNVIDRQIPELLDVTVSENGKMLHIVGVRVKKLANKEKEQLNFLDMLFYNKDYDNLLCVGDFNRVAGNTKFVNSKAKVYSPRTYNNENWSFVHNNGDVVGIDLVVAKGIQVNKEASRKNQYAEYDWNFINRNNGYGILTKESNLNSLTCRPDHAILQGTFLF